MNLKDYYIFLLVSSIMVRRREVVVKFQSGKITGIITTSLRGTEYYSFRGIFYAESPIGLRRFQSPIAKKRLNEDEEFDAKEEGPVCCQKDLFTNKIIGQENCLILNVYTRGNTISNIKWKYPVMVWIHGGGWHRGFSSSWLYGPDKFMDKEVVLVSINYRLGPLGFMSTNDENAPGNYGMLDQVEALKWIKENIVDFGGDPEKVTLFGQSAGGVNAFYHMLSPLSKGLFHQCIAMSGTPLSPWANVNDPVHWARKLAVKLNCSLENSKKLVDCLRNADFYEITKFGYTLSDCEQIHFFPTVDGRFLESNPKEMMADGRIHSKVPVITGITKDEGAGLYALCHEKFVEFSDEFLKETVTNFFSLSGNASRIANLIKDKYFKTKVDLSDNFEVAKVTSRFMSEAMAIATLITVDYLNSADIKTYTYSFDFEGVVSITQLAGLPQRFVHLGVGHCDDLLQIFATSGYSLSNDEISNGMISRWTNFAIYGDPNGELDVNWPQVANNVIPVFHIDKPCSVKFENDMVDPRFEFWLEEVPKALTDFSEVKNEQQFC